MLVELALALLLRYLLFGVTEDGGPLKLLDEEPWIMLLPVELTDPLEAPLIEYWSDEPDTEPK